MTGNIKKIINYMREFNLKAIYPLKFQVKELENTNGSDIYFIILIENENYHKFVLILNYDLSTNVVKLALKFDEIIDFGRRYSVFGVYEGSMKARIEGRSRANRNEDPAPGASPQPFLAEALGRNHETIVLRTLRPPIRFTIFNPSESSEPGAREVGEMNT